MEHPEPVIWGVDINADTLKMCRQSVPRARITCADGQSLPFPAQTFEIVFCHFLLMWVRDPLVVLREMRRITVTAGHILVLAEPDYSDRIDEPSSLRPAGDLQTKSLALQGADVSIGGRLVDLFRRAGIRIIETGEIRRKMDLAPDPAEGDEEWEVLETDLERILPRDKIAELRALDSEARGLGTRRIHVPTYFAWGQV